MNKKNYSRLFIMAAISFLLMYVLMYSMVDKFENIFFNFNQFYMALLMVVPMIIIEFFLMKGMYADRRLNNFVIIFISIVFVISFIFIRQQISIGDKQFLKSMIPHHAAAILMCKKSSLQDDEIKNLCQKIISNQQSEIDWMKTKLKNYSKLEIKNIGNSMKITSPAFQDNILFPKKYACDGSNINPPVFISDVPEKTKSLALVLRDPDAPSGNFIHWLVWNISPDTKEIKENSVPVDSVQGATGRGKPGYVGPCPPSGSHRYFLKVYSLDTMLSLLSSANISDFEKSIQGHILDQTEIMAKYSKQ